MWLTPVYPEQLQTFQALCDICKAADIPSTPLFIGSAALNRGEAHL
jgi:hypothetical protein